MSRRRVLTQINDPRSPACTSPDVLHSVEYRMTTIGNVLPPASNFGRAPAAHSSACLYRF
jgi:hypothetical protein